MNKNIGLSIERHYWKPDGVILCLTMEYSEHKENGFTQLFPSVVSCFPVEAAGNEGVLLCPISNQSLTRFLDQCSII